MHWIRLEECDPVRWVNALVARPGFVWLDSAQAGHASARFSYICVAPVSTACFMDGTLQVDGVASDQPPLPGLRTWLANYTNERINDGPPFQGGAVGFLAYDFAAQLVDGFHSRHSARSQRSLEFGLYDTLLAFDHERSETWIMSAGITRLGTSGDMALAAARVQALSDLENPPLAAQETGPVAWQPTQPKSAYLDSVGRTQDYITDGDIYQANISQRFHPDIPIKSPFRYYLAMRASNPAPFSAFAAFSDRVLASASPERLISLSADGMVRAQPIKGTIKRATDPSEDRRLRQQLEGSAKDRAENVMIVDLLRNDLSRVCKPHSVIVPSLCVLETFAGLHHLTSTVEAQLNPGCDAFDLITAVFPGGSITGAPKLRAMQIIDELETDPRGAFTGSLGYIGFDGAADFNILIRTVEIDSEGETLWAGGGITLLSDPEAEYRETLLKIARLNRSPSAAAAQS
ncbi:MAG: anthranilate synthase component I family protein [Alphaproteobacteria bacterium]|nr:anthranilate synthase component I family protein [Alphaproteobacteria bacterium]MBU2083522.1 anthranilate synthase component I family protein [Alphaproteobacteria bacterium]MBU2143512.1 anthranilate synthase component I family protein [Alphaproteobacteria bacterium]MBU2196087.1 anthranilate synthase component I family protein [Alphaproteobacteria bacterium]